MGAMMETSGSTRKRLSFSTISRRSWIPRQRGKVVYKLDEVLLLCLLAVLAEAESIVDIARFGEKKLALLRRFRPFGDGTPSHDQLGTLNATAFQQCFVAWVATVTGQRAEVIAIGDKTSRRTFAKKGRRRHCTWSRLSPRASGEMKPNSLGLLTFDAVKRF